MSLTTDGLIGEREHPLNQEMNRVPSHGRAALPSFFNADGSVKSGVQRLYRWGAWGLSLVNHPALHSFPFAWEAAVIRFPSQDNNRFSLDYSTPLANDVEVFSSDVEADAFIQKAKRYFVNQTVPTP